MEIIVKLSTEETLVILEEYARRVARRVCPTDYSARKIETETTSFGTTFSFNSSTDEPGLDC
jgi:hypothetical protein